MPRARAGASFAVTDAGARCAKILRYVTLNSEIGPRISLKGAEFQAIVNSCLTMNDINAIRLEIRKLAA